MPDANKIEKLGEIGYRVQPCCGLCKQGVFPPNGMGAGSCKLFDYENVRAKKAKPLAVTWSGRCSSFKFNEKKKEHLEQHGFLQFVEELTRVEDSDDAFRILAQGVARAVSLVRRSETVPEQTISEWLSDIARDV